MEPWADSLQQHLQDISSFNQILQQAGTVMLADGTYNKEEFIAQANRLALRQTIHQNYQQRLYDAAVFLDKTISIAGVNNFYKNTLDRILGSGLAIPLLNLRLALRDLRLPEGVRGQARTTLDQLGAARIDVDKVITQGATQLANFLIDGTYNFTFILFPTPSQPNGAVGTGTAAIDSEYDGYTHGLAQKIINQNITAPFSMNILQTLDISYNSILIDTYGTSNTGKYTIDGNILTIYSYGYSNGTIFFGEFINDIVKIIKTDIGYIVQHNKINPDNSIGPLIDVVYYVRQLTIPDEVRTKFEEAFQVLDGDRDGFVDSVVAQEIVDQVRPDNPAKLATNVKAFTGPALASYISQVVKPAN